MPLDPIAAMCWRDALLIRRDDLLAKTVQRKGFPCQSQALGTLIDCQTPDPCSRITVNLQQW